MWVCVIASLVAARRLNHGQQGAAHQNQQEARGGPDREPHDGDGPEVLAVLSVSVLLLYSSYEGFLLALPKAFVPSSLFSSSLLLSLFLSHISSWRSWNCRETG